MNPYKITQAIPDDHPIVIALQNSDEDKVKLHLDAGVSPYAPGLIAGALASGKEGIVQAFLDHDLDPSLPFNMHGETPIFRSISTRHRNIKILELLLKKGASVHQDTTGSSTPLHTASAEWPDAIPFLLQAGADVNAASTIGRTPLMSAAHRNQIQSLELLLAAGAGLEDRDNEGTTPLILAARAGSFEAVEWLLNHGADIQAKDNRGKSATDWAQENGHTEIANLLRSRIDS